ncbi:MAG: hypothetical protein B6D64_15085 [Bacteroidetes bacterium 4484_276]|nr:MAG: hypothetical protein B6D64_15085 [Bacteroidetes bacterium 4484_276]
MKFKSILIIVATLVIGFIIGFLTNGQLTKSRIQSFVKMGTSEGFKTKLYHVINPDESQQKAIEPILEKYAEKIHESVVNSRGEMKSINDEMIEELKPFLTDDQIFRIKNAHSRLGRGWRSPHGGPKRDGSGPKRDR